MCRLNGIVESHRLPRKEELRQLFSDHIVISPEQLPPKVDLRSFMTPVEDQSKLGSWYVSLIKGLRLIVSFLRLI